MPDLCEHCDTYPADPQSGLCEGCEDRAAELYNERREWEYWHEEDMKDG